MIYLLQFFNITIFGFLQKTYGDLVIKKCEFDVDFIDKNQFINFYIETQKQSFKLKII